MSYPFVKTVFFSVKFSCMVALSNLSLNLTEKLKELTKKITSVTNDRNRERDKLLVEFRFEIKLVEYNIS